MLGPWVRGAEAAEAAPRAGGRGAESPRRGVQDRGEGGGSGLVGLGQLLAPGGSFGKVALGCSSLGVRSRERRAERRQGLRFHPFATPSTCFWRRWTKWETGLQSEAGAARGPCRRRGTEPCFSGHLKEPLGPRSLKITCLCICRVGLPGRLLPLIKVRPVTLLIKLSSALGSLTVCLRSPPPILHKPSVPGVSVSLIRAHRPQATPAAEPRPPSELEDGKSSAPDRGGEGPGGTKACRP